MTLGKNEFLRKTQNCANVRSGNYPTKRFIFWTIRIAKKKIRNFFNGTQPGFRVRSNKESESFPIAKALIAIFYIGIFLYTIQNLIHPPFFIHTLPPDPLWPVTWMHGMPNAVLTLQGFYILRVLSPKILLRKNRA